MLNIIAVQGRIVRTPELKTTNTGKSFVNFCVACERGRKDENGQNISDFFDATAWGHTAEFLCKYFAKGQLCAIDGRLQTRKYTDRDGNNRTAYEIVANNISFCGGKSENQHYQDGVAPVAPVANAAPEIDDSMYSAGGQFVGVATIDDDGDLPF